MAASIIRSFGGAATTILALQKIDPSQNSTQFSSKIISTPEKPINSEASNSVEAEKDGLTWLALSGKEPSSSPVEIEEWRSDYHNPRNPGQKLKDIGALPLIGAGVTLGALCYGLYAGLLKGDQRVGQNMMRLRVGAQGVTVILLVFAMAQAARKREKDYSERESLRKEIKECVD